MVLAVLATSAGAADHVPVITNPDWVQLPSAEDLGRNFPPNASSTGSAILKCSVEVAGRLHDCIVLSEDPPDQGFGAAALKMAAGFKMRPMARDGVPVDGGVVTIPITFSFSGQTTPTWTHQPTAAELDAVWPPGAKNEGGQAMLACTLTSRGQVRGCKVASETPRGKGFGAAALNLVPVLGLTPARSGGVAAESEVHIPINFPPPAPRQAGVDRYGGSLTGLTNAPWKTTPSIADMAAAWPKAAAALSQGHATLRCRFKPDGVVGPCSIENEDPVGAGFGAAALGLAGRFSVLGADPGTMSQARINLPFTFINPRDGAAGLDRVSRAEWIRYLSADTMTSLFPAEAIKAGLKTGHGVADCTVAADGSLTKCTAASEDPTGFGFGAAAAVAATYFALNPWTSEGRPADGAQIRIPIRFVLADEPPPDRNVGAAAPVH